MEKVKGLSFKARKYILTKETAIIICVFVLSRVHIYADVAPLGLAAMFAWENALCPSAVMAFVLGTATAELGFTSYLRHIFSLLLAIALKKILGRRVPDAVLLFATILLGGMAALFIRSLSAFAAMQALAEAASAFLFYFLFSCSYKALQSFNGKGFTEKETAAVFFSLITISLGFCELEMGAVSIASVIMLFLAMAVACKNRPSVSALMNMGMGFYFFVFSPKNTECVLMLAAAGMAASRLRKFGKWAVPASYGAAFMLFYLFGAENTAFSVFDLLISSVIFLAVPERIYDSINTAVARDDGANDYILVSDRLMQLSDTFSDLADSFEPSAPNAGHSGNEAVLQTVKAVCTHCFFSKSCRINAEEELTGMVYGRENKGKDGAGEKISRHCRRKKELQSELLKNLQLIRMEALWQSRLNEETEAISGQMRCVSGIFLRLSDERESLIKRDEAVEERIRLMLKKSGISPKKLMAGKTGRGIFEVKMEASPCKENGMCESVIKSAVQSALGFEVERVGIKNCARCSFSYAAFTPFGVNAVKLSVPLEQVCGDSTAFARLDAERYAIALSDGMGTGSSAAAVSAVAAHMSLKLLSAGTDLVTTAKMINSLIINRGKGKSFATLDIALINLVTGRVEYLKNGASSSFILTAGGRVRAISGAGSPLGAVGECRSEVKKIRLGDGDVLIMVSDGVCDAFGANGEKKLSDWLSGYMAGSVEELAEFVARKAISAYGKKIKDDMTVVAIGCIKRKRGGNNMDKKEA